MSAGLYSASLQWTTPPSVLAKSVNAWGDKLIEMLRAVVGSYRQLIENYAKEHAPWTDRTGHARQSLVATADVEQGAGGFTGTLTLASGADYGIWLELAHGGRFAIIMQTLQQFEGEIMQTIQANL